MRAGPLSRPEVIDLLNRHFVPVFVVNEDYREDGPAPEAERALMDRALAENAVVVAQVTPFYDKEGSRARRGPHQPGPEEAGRSSGERSAGAFPSPRRPPRPKAR